MRLMKTNSRPTASARYDRELHNLLNAAIDLSPGEIRPYLERTASSLDLALEVEALLREPVTEDDFLRPPLEERASWSAKIAA